MKFTDPVAIKLLKRVNSIELENDVEWYPEDERDSMKKRI